jgi:hypothetical protein
MLVTLRRYFVETIPVGNNKDNAISNGEIGRNYCNKLFEIEDQLTELSLEDRKSERLRLEKPVLEAFGFGYRHLTHLKAQG